MTTSSGNSISTSQIGGGSEEVELMMDQRKRKRMQSNRESARRSRMRKQKHLDDLMMQVNQIRKDNHQIMSTLSITNQQYHNIEAENSILRAQMSELTQRLRSLNHIIHCINTTAPPLPPPPPPAPATTTTCFDIEGVDYDFGEYDNSLHAEFIHHWNNNNSSLGYLNQVPIMASADMFQC